MELVPAYTRNDPIPLLEAYMTGFTHVRDHQGRLMLRIANFLILFMFMVVLTVAGTADAATKSKKKAKADAPNNKYSAIVIDAETGAILSQSNPDKVLHPASLTKIMTLMLTFEALERGQLRPTDRIRISKRAANMSPSKLGLKPGETIRVQDAIYAVVTKSANDIAVALAEAVGGSEDTFVRQMNAKAQAIGMNRTRFVNASGWHDPRQVSTARDMAKLGRTLIVAHPKYYPVFNKRSFTYNGHVYRNHNRLMDSYAGMDGIKTGFVNASGFNLVASAKRGNQRLVAVVFGGRTTQSRNTQMASLLDTGFTDLSRIQYAALQKRQQEQNAAVVQAINVNPDDKIVAVDTSSVADTRMGMVTMSGTTLRSEDRLMQTAPQVSSFVQSQPARPAAVGAVRVASLATATDAQPQAALPVNPLYTVPSAPGRQSAAVPVQPSGYATSGTWSIQVGAYQSRAATDQALYQALHKLPPELSSRATAMIVPLRTAEATWMFRARLSGFSEREAVQACARLKDCLTISPQAN